MYLFRLWWVLSIFIFASCSKMKEQNQLEGMWDYQITKTPSGKTIRENPNLKNQQYSFYDNEMYDFQAIDESNGKGDLYVRTGKYNLKSEGNKWFLTLSQRELDGVLTRKYEIFVLTDSVMQWKNERGFTYFFNHTEQSWYDDND